jgi:hypothetical protein
MKTLSRFLLILLSAVFVLFCRMPCAAETTPEDECEALTPRQQNEVSISIPKISVDESGNTSNDLADMAGTHNDARKSTGGITSATPLIDYEIFPNLALLPDRKGVCARPAFRLRIGHSSINIYMDREIQRGSCYNAILTHEMHHVQIYKNYSNHHIEQIRKNVEDKFNGRVYFFKSIFAAKQYVEILGQVFIQHVGEKFFAEVNAEQNALDTEAEYLRVQRECFYW